MAAENVSFLERRSGPDLAFCQTSGHGPSVVFCGGFRSDMDGRKARFFEAQCRARGQAYIRFDYSGHGRSGGRFEDGTISHWLADVLHVLDTLTTGPAVLVGSSMGGWLSLLAARQRPERVQALVGLAAAPDFTEQIYRDNREACERQFAERGWFDLPNDYSDEPYVITRALVEDGRAHMLLGAPLRLGARVRLVQGMRDTDVPWRTALRLRKILLDDDVDVTLLPESDHRLSTEEDLALIDAIIRDASGLKAERNANLVSCQVRAV